MKQIFGLGLFLSVALPLSAVAEELGLKPAKTLSYTEFGGSYVHESVSNQRDPWTESQVEVMRKFAERKLLIASTAVFGRHWFARDWALTYSLGRTRQGVSTRDAAGVGLRYRF